MTVITLFHKTGPP
jgi:cytochrome P450